MGTQTSPSQASKMVYAWTVDLIHESARGNQSPSVHNAHGNQSRSDHNTVLGHLIEFISRAHGKQLRSVHNTYPSDSTFTFGRAFIRVTASKLGAYAPLSVVFGDPVSTYHHISLHVQAFFQLHFTSDAIAILCQFDVTPTNIVLVRSTSPVLSRQENCHDQKHCIARCRNGHGRAHSGSSRATVETDGFFAKTKWI